MKPMAGAFTHVISLVKLLKVIHEVSVTPDGTDVTVIEYTISLGVQSLEFSVNAFTAVDAEAAPS